MPGKRAHSSEAQERLDRLFAEYLEAAECGEVLDSQDIMARFPELAEAVAAHKDLGRLMAPLCGLGTTADYELDQTEVLPAGTVIGDYELLEVIGRGGMGIVYKARNLKFNIVAALKMLLSGPRATEKEVQRFIETTKNLADPRHPNIVKVHTGGEYEGRLYFTMELIEGGDLTRAPAGAAVPLRQAARLAAKISRAVHHAHQRETVHRDLKPSNVLLDSEGEPYVADFGLAKQLQRQQRNDGGYLVGAPAFVAPEQIDGQATVLSDVYGLGTILYWLLTGQQLFQGDTVGEILRKVREELPEPPRTLNPRLKHWINRYLELICLRCLDKNSERRYQSADGLAVDLERWLVGSRPLGVPVHPVDRFRLWCRSHSKTIATSAAIALLSVISLLFGHLWWDSHRQRAIENALVEVRSGDFDRTEKALAEAQRWGASPAWSCMLRGQLALHRGQSNEAIGHLVQAVNLMPQSIALRRLAEGEREHARQHFTWSLDTGIVHYFAYQWSRAFLTRMENDGQWPPWIPGK